MQAHYPDLEMNVTNLVSAADGDNPRLELDQQALDAKRSLQDGANVDRNAPWREDIIRLLNDSLATELVCSCVTSATTSLQRPGNRPRSPTNFCSMPRKKQSTPT